MPPLVSIIVPCFNEAPTLGESVERLVRAHEAAAWTCEVLIIDDGSTDGSRDVAASLATRHDLVRVIEQPRNEGKGAAVRTGLEQSRGDIVLIHDADLEYDPADHARVLAPIIDGRADAVIGSRFLGTAQAHRVLYYWHYAANRFITLLCDMAANLNLTDIECCTKAFSRELIDEVLPRLRERRFGIEPELIIRAAQARIPNTADASTNARPPRIYEVPVSYAGRTYAEGKKIGWKDGLRALHVIARCAFS